MDLERDAIGKFLETEAGSCPSCGSESRGELGYVPGGTGQPVSCSDDWHDADAKSPGDQTPRQ